eukprot:gene10955-biopygen12366
MRCTQVPWGGGSAVRQCRDPRAPAGGGYQSRTRTGLHPAPLCCRTDSSQQPSLPPVVGPVKFRRRTSGNTGSSADARPVTRGVPSMCIRQDRKSRRARTSRTVSAQRERTERALAPVCSCRNGTGCVIMLDASNAGMPRTVSQMKKGFLWGAIDFAYNCGGGKVKEQAQCPQPSPVHSTSHDAHRAGQQNEQPTPPQMPPNRVQRSTRHGTPEGSDPDVDANWGEYEHAPRAYLCYSVLIRATPCNSVLLHVTACYSVSVLLHSAPYFPVNSVLLCVAPWCSVHWRTAPHTSGFPGHSVLLRILARLQDRKTWVRNRHKNTTFGRPPPKYNWEHLRFISWPNRSRPPAGFPGGITPNCGVQGQVWETRPSSVQGSRTTSMAQPAVCEAWRGVSRPGIFCGAETSAPRFQPARARAGGANGSR